MYHGHPCNEFPAASPDEHLLWEYLQHSKVDQHRSVRLVYVRISMKESLGVYYISCERFPIPRTVWLLHATSST